MNEHKDLFVLLNQKLFDAGLSTPDFQLDVSKKFGLRWNSDSNILLFGSEFHKFSMYDFIVNLIHEMIHIKNHSQRIVDVSVNQYHNKFFLREAIQLGFHVIRHKTQGWCVLSTFAPRNIVDVDFYKSPTNAACNRLHGFLSQQKFNRTFFFEAVSSIKQAVDSIKPAKLFFLKYECKCPAPHNSVRSGRRPDSPNALNAFCKICNSDFICVSPVDD